MCSPKLSLLSIRTPSSVHELVHSISSLSMTLSAPPVYSLLLALLKHYLEFFFVFQQEIIFISVKYILSLVVKLSHNVIMQ